MSPNPGSTPPEDPWSRVRFRHDSDQLKKGGPWGIALMFFFSAVVGAGLGFLATLEFVGEPLVASADPQSWEYNTWVLVVMMTGGALFGMGFTLVSLLRYRRSRARRRGNGE